MKTNLLYTLSILCIQFCFYATASNAQCASLPDCELCTFTGCNNGGFEWCFELPAGDTLLITGVQGIVFVNQDSVNGGEIYTEEGPYCILALDPDPISVSIFTLVGWNISNQPACSAVFTGTGHDCILDGCTDCFFAPDCDCDEEVQIPFQCDDGNPCTMNDRELRMACDESVCVPCEGVPIDCVEEGVTQLIPCDDGNENTINDVEEVLNCDFTQICQPCTGEMISNVKENEILTDLRIFPNPGTNLLSISLDKPTNIQQVYAYDIAGKKIKIVNNMKLLELVEINTTNWSTGLYSVFILFEDEIHQKYWIKQ